MDYVLRANEVSLWFGQNQKDAFHRIVDKMNALLSDVCL